MTLKFKTLKGEIHWMLWSNELLTNRAIWMISTVGQKLRDCHSSQLGLGNKCYVAFEYLAILTSMRSLNWKPALDDVPYFMRKQEARKTIFMLNILFQRRDCYKKTVGSIIISFQRWHFYRHYIRKWLSAVQSKTWR